MDSRHREIIDEYRNLLTKNLILTDDFYRVLVTHGVFTDGLIKEVKKAPRGEQQSQLLDLLLTRSNAGFGKFCDVLEITGHHFLSDCLREAENTPTLTEFDLEDFLKKLPFMEKSIKNEQHKLSLQKYIRDKIHNEVVKQTWRGDISTKESLMVSRQKQIEQIWHFEEESKIKDKNVSELQDDYMKLQERADDLRREIKSLHKHIEDMAKQHEEKLATQLKFNMANDRHLNRLNERAEDAGSYLKVIHEEVKEVLGNAYYEKQARSDYENLEENFKKLLKNHKELTEMSNRFKEERSYMSNQLAGITVNDNHSLKPHFQDYIMKIEETKAVLDQKIQELQDINAKQQKKIEELSWVQAKLDEERKAGDESTENTILLLQKEIEQSTAKLNSRDEKITGLEKDLQSLSQRVKQLEKELSESQENVTKARQMANQMIPKAQTPPKTPATSRPVVKTQSPITSHYNKKPTMTRSTGVYIMDKNTDPMSSLDAIKGQGLNVADQQLPTGVKRTEQSGNLQAAVKNASVMNGAGGRNQISTRNTRRY